MPKFTSRITKKFSDLSQNQIITLWEECVTMQEYINKLVLDLRKQFKVKEYAEIMLLLFNKTHDDWVIFKNSKAELDAANYLGQPNYKSIKAASLLESTKTYIKYLESIQNSIDC